MLRKPCLVLLAVLFLACTCGALSETILINPIAGEALSVGDTIALEERFTLAFKGAKEYDVFMGLESGGAKQHLVLSFDLTNFYTEPLDVNVRTSASLCYDDDFSFEFSHLVSNPGGTYWLEKNGKTYSIYVYGISEDGAPDTYYGALSTGYEHIIALDSTKNKNETGEYMPADDCFYDAQDKEIFACLDGCKTVLEPLVKRTYHYVFTVPNIVAEENGLCLATLTIDGETYEIHF